MVKFTDRKGKIHMINKRQFKRLVESLAKRAKIIHEMKVIEEDRFEED